MAALPTSSTLRSLISLLYELDIIGLLPTLGTIALHIQPQYYREPGLA